MKTKTVLYQLSQMPGFKITSHPIDHTVGGLIIETDYGAYDGGYVCVSEALFNALVYFSAKQMNLLTTSSLDKE